MLDAQDLDFDKGDGLVPAIVQHPDTGRVLMLGYMNADALAQTQATGLVTFYSRTRQRLWTKGETSGHTLALQSLHVDCDRDTLLVKAVPTGPVCHTGTPTCFADDGLLPPLHFLYHLRDVIHERHANPAEGSYTASLFAKGLNKIAQKVGEEAVELVIEAKDDNDTLFKEEAADLLFHLLVLLEAKGIALDDVLAVLQQRHQ